MLNTKSLSWIILTTGILIGTASKNAPVQAQSVVFECAADKQNVPTTYAETPGGIVEIFKWKSTFWKPPYTPQQRCLEVTDRLNQFKPQNIVAGSVNSYNVICAGNTCNPDGSNILLTLRPDQNSNQILQEIDATRDGVGGPSAQLNGSSGSRQGRKSHLYQAGQGFLGLNLAGYIQSAPRIPRKLSGSSNSRGTGTSSLNQQPVTIPSNTGNSSSTSSPGSVW